jgi:hypothetical protein
MCPEGTEVVVDPANLYLLFSGPLCLSLELPSMAGRTHGL